MQSFIETVSGLFNLKRPANLLVHITQLETSTASKIVSPPLPSSSSARETVYLLARAFDDFSDAFLMAHVSS